MIEPPARISPEKSELFRQEMMVRKVWIEGCSLHGSTRGCHKIILIALEMVCRALVPSVPDRSLAVC